MPLVVIVDKFCTHGSWSRKAGLTVVVMDRIRCAAECTILSGTYKHNRSLYKFSLEPINTIEVCTHSNILQRSIALN